MSMTGGTASCTVATDGTATYSGSGMSLALAQARGDALLTQLQAIYPPPLTSTQQSFYQRFLAQTCADAQVDAGAIVTYLQANAVAHVTNQSLGLTPIDNTGNTPIQPPASPVDVPIQ